MLRNIFNLSFVNFLQAISAFAIVIGLTRFYDKYEYATYRQVFLPFEILSPILGIGLHSSIYFFFPRERDVRKLLWDFLVLVLISCLGFQILLFIVGEDLIVHHFNNQALAGVVLVVGIFSFFSIANNIFNSYFVLIDKTKNLIYLNSVFFILMICGVFGLAVVKEGITSIIILRVVLYGILFFGFFIYSGVYSNGNLQLPTTGKVIEILKYSIPISASAIIGNFSYHLDKWIVSINAPPDTFAVYVNGAIEIPFIAIITSSVSSVMIAKMTLMIKEDKIEHAVTVFKQSAILTSIFLFPVFAYLMVYAERVVTLLFGESYIDSSGPFRIYLLLLPIRIIFYGPILVVLGKSSQLVKRSLVELALNLILSFILLRSFGYLGVALGTILSVYFWTVPFNLYTIMKSLDVRFRELIPFNFLGRVLLSSFFTIVLVYAVSFWFSNVGEWLFIFLTGVFFVLVYPLFLILFKVVLAKDYKVLANIG